ncbi:MAG: Ig-like domain-containing protein [Gemmatimonadaceae bacterium]
MRRAAFILLVLLAACSGGDSSTVPVKTQPVDTTPAVVAVATVAVASPVAQLLPGGTAQLSVLLKDANGAALGGRNVTWTVSSSSVLAVSAGGLVTAIASGSATVTASSEGKSGSTSIAVGEVNPVTSAGGTVIAAGGKVQLAFPAGAVTSNTAIAVTPIAAPASNGLIIAGTAYEFGPSGSFAVPIDATIKYDASQLPANASQKLLGLYTLVGPIWELIPNSIVDSVAHTVHAPLSHFSTYVVCQFPCGAETAKIDITGAGITIVPIKQGASAQYTTETYVYNIPLTSVTFSLQGAPSGISVVIGGNTSNIVLINAWTFSVASSVAPGQYPVKLVARAAGATDAILNIVISVSAVGYDVKFNPTTIPVVQGSTGTSAITITRDGITAPVVFSVATLPTGVTASFSAVPTNGLTSTLTLTAAANAPTGTTNNIMVKSVVFGQTDKLFPISITVVSASGFSLAGTPAVATVIPGGTASTGIKATRANGFSGVIAYAVFGLTNGLTAAITATVVADSSKLTFNATNITTPGNYSVVVTGTSGGKSDTLTILVTVGSPGVSTVQLDFSRCISYGQTLWLAFQDGSGAFTRVNGTNGLYSFNLASGKGAFALVQSTATGFDTYVVYGSPAELPSANFCFAPRGTKRVGVSITGLSVGDAADVFVGGSGTTLQAALPTQVLGSIDEGSLDIVGWRYHGSTGDNTIRGIIRRDQNIPNNGTAAVLDFNGAESFAAVSASASVSGGGSAALSYRTGGGCGSPAILGNALAFNGTIYGVPTSAQRSTDRHVFSTNINTSNGFRGTSNYFRAVTSQSIAAPAPITAPTVTTLTGPYRRLQVDFTLPTDYSVAKYTYGDGSNNITLQGNPGYFGGNTMSLPTPDLSAVTGYVASWFPSSSSHGNNSFQTANTANNTCDDGFSYRSAGIFGNN